MSRLSSSLTAHPLGAHDGRALLSAPQSILKAALEAEREISLITGPRHEAFSSLFTAAAEEPASTLLRQHGLSVVAVPHATRGIVLAHRAAVSGRAAIAVVPNAQLDNCFRQLAATIAAPLHSAGSLCVLMEDHPLSEGATCPRQTATRLGIPCIEPTGIGGLRDVFEDAVRLSRAAGSPVAIVVHAAILRSLRTLDMRPNRILVPGSKAGSVDLVMARRRRRPRWTESRDVLRMARRLEFNHVRALPNPGERVPVGFVTVGPCDASIDYVTDALHLQGRVPVLNLGLIHPVDDVAVTRLLSRCEKVVVLEPRPTIGSVESAVLAVAEQMRHRGDRPATVWGRSLPPSGQDQGFVMEVDDALHPSILARKIIHLLHMIRPTMQVAQRLAPEPPSPPVQALPRNLEMGTGAAIRLLRRIASDVDQWLRGQVSYLQEQGIPPTSLAIDGVEPAPSGSSQAVRHVRLEFWSGREFVEGGLFALRQAARDDRPWIMLVCDFDVPDNQDIERLVRGTIPAERTERVAIRTADLNDRSALRESMQAAALAPQLSIILVKDGPPPRFDVSAIERGLADIDRFGFEPRQRLTWTADQACLFSTPSEDELAEHQAALGAISMRSEWIVDRFTKAPRGRVRFRIQPLYEQIEVLRTRPPAWIWRSALHSSPGSGPALPRLDLPVPVHRRNPIWRAHVAGFRGAGPGVATLVLCEAGRTMGYEVACTHDPTAVGPGRRAWAQVIFTRSRSQIEREQQQRTRGSAAQLLTIAPFGEVDLLLGLDTHETLRAVRPEDTLRVAHPERTNAVANVGAFSDEDDRSLSSAAQQSFRDAISKVTTDAHRLIEDFADTCRAWFYTDRVTDVAMLGAAFQAGLIPVSLEAIESSLAHAEERGFGRSVEAFQFGRQLAANPAPFRRPRNEREDDIEQMIRRMALGIRSSGWRGLARAREFEGLARRSLQAMPGLGETSPGRRAQRDFVTALYRAIEWGGFEYAVQYADVLTSLYRADRGDTGRALTRSAVLPLAETMLIHDPIFIASMATNAEQRRVLRQRLNIKHARGDRIERRYLTRFELFIMGRRFRADLRSSDWPAKIARAARYVVPQRWRGTRRERDLRIFMLDFIRQADHGARADYARWSEAMQRLHHRARENRLRDMTLAEIRMLTEPVVRDVSNTLPRVAV